MFGPGYTVSETIQIWGTIISAVVMLATIAQVVVAYLIARSIRLASDKGEKTLASRHVNEQWQQYNSLVVYDGSFRKAAMSFEDWQGTEEEFQLRYLTFMHLNVAHDAYNANRLSDTPNGHLEANYREMIALLRSQRQIAISILKGNRGYDKDFCRMCLEIIGEEPLRTAEQPMPKG